MRNRIKLDEQGVEILRLFSRNLKEISGEYIAAGNRLLDDMGRVKNCLGSDALQVEKLIDDLNAILQHEMYPLEELSEYCERLAVHMEILILKKLSGALNVAAQNNIGQREAQQNIERRGAVQSATGNTAAFYMDITRKTPRDLVQTNYGMEKDSQGNLVYDSPMELDQYLCIRQGNADSDYRGTCGLCCCANVLKMSGVRSSELQMIQYASNTSSPNGFKEKLCTTGNADASQNGGTSVSDRKMILEHFGIPSSIMEIELDSDGKAAYKNLERIASCIEAGKGVILSVHASVLWKDNEISLEEDWHAVTVTSVKRNQKGELLGFFLCDSADDGTHYYSAECVRSALFGVPYNVTQSIIR